MNKTKPNSSASPWTELRTSHPTVPPTTHYHPGLTKREWFAGMIMQGILAGKPTNVPTKDIVEAAILGADALIANLNVDQNEQ